MSLSSVRKDYERKVKLYREAGVREYWIVDTGKEMVTVYDFEHEKEAVVYHFTNQIKVGIFKELYLNLSGMIIY